MSQTALDFEDKIDIEAVADEASAGHHDDESITAHPQETGFDHEDRGDNVNMAASYAAYPAIQPYLPYVPGAMVPQPPPPTDPLLTGQKRNLNVYTDAANMMDPALDTRRNRGGVVDPFPDKLHRMLSKLEKEGKSDIASFLSHGRAFIIHKPKVFEEEIMPRFFKQSKLSSFKRQLNLYKFRRISQGPDNGSYYHELFLRGRPGLCVNMKRTKVKGDLKIKRDPETEPDFYRYPPAQPTHTQQAQTPGAAATYPKFGYQNFAYPMPDIAPYTAAQIKHAAPSTFQHPPYGFLPYSGYVQFPMTLPYSNHMTPASASMTLGGSQYTASSPQYKPSPGADQANIHENGQKDNTAQQNASSTSGRVDIAV